MANSVPSYESGKSIDYAMQQEQEHLTALRKAYKDGELTDEGIKRLADAKGIEAEGLIEYLNMSRLDMEKNPYYKSDLTNSLSGAYSLPRKKGETIEIDGMKITCLSDPKPHVIEGTQGAFGIGTEYTKWNCADYKIESEYLGDFEFNSYEYDIAYKLVHEDDGSVSKLPYLRYVGPDVNHSYFSFIGTWDTFTSVPVIPDGVKCLDYTFAGRSNLDYCPSSIPDSVISAHCAFAGCTKMNFYKGELGTNGNMWQGEDTLVLPDGLEDLSGMFKDCRELRCGFKSTSQEAIPKAAVNVSEAWNGCESLVVSDEFDSTGFTWFGWGKNRIFRLPQFGAATNPYLSQELAKDAFAAISDRQSVEYKKMYGMTAKEDADNRDYAIDNGQSNLDKDTTDGLDKGKFSDAMIASTSVYQSEVLDGKVVANTELASNESRSDNAIFVGNDTIINDPTGLKKSVNEKASSGFMKSLLINGAVGTIVGGIVGGQSDNKLIGAAAGVGSVGLLNWLNNKAESTPAISWLHVPNLSSAMVPILTWTSNILPDGSIKDKLIEFRNKLPGGEVYAYNQQVVKDNLKWDDQYNVGNELKEERLSWIFQRAESAAFFPVGKFMENNAVACAKEMTFIAVANSGEESARDVNEVLSKSVTAMTEHWNDICGKDGISDEVRSDMQNYYVSLLQSIESFSKGARVGTLDAYLPGSAKYNLSLEGADMVNRACLDTIMPELQALDEKYHFMDDEAWDKVQKLDITGVNIENIKNYSSGYFDELRSRSKETAESLQDGFESEHDEQDTKDSTPTDTTEPNNDSSFSNNFNVVTAGLNVAKSALTGVTSIGAAEPVNGSEFVDTSEPTSNSGSVREVPFEDTPVDSSLSEPVMTKA